MLIFLLLILFPRLIVYVVQYKQYNTVQNLKLRADNPQTTTMQTILLFALPPHQNGIRRGLGTPLILASFFDTRREQVRCLDVCWSGSSERLLRRLRPRQLRSFLCQLSSRIRRMTTRQGMFGTAMAANATKPAAAELLLVTAT